MRGKNGSEGQRERSRLRKAHFDIFVHYLDLKLGG